MIHGGERASPRRRTLAAIAPESVRCEAKDGAIGRHCACYVSVSFLFAAAMGHPPYHLTDWHRLLFGNAQWPFLLEVLLRTGVTYLLLIGAMRLLGRRVAAQFTLFEVSIVVTLAAAIGVPLQAANRGLLPPLIIAAVVIVLQRCLGRLGINHRKIETAISGELTTLIRDGRLLIDDMHRTVLGPKKVFELLRLQGYQQLGEVSRAYLEPSGGFSVVPAGLKRPGLSVIPEFDSALQHEAQVHGHFACRACGHTVASEHCPQHACPFCRSREWLAAVLELKQ